MTERSVARAKIIATLAETFRRYGYEGASVARLSDASGLSKASLYYHFPGGKEEMAEAVLADLTAWFNDHVFAPLRGAEPPEDRIAAMLAEVNDYYRGGSAVCLFGFFAMGETRERFSAPVADFFANWIASLSAALAEAGVEPEEAIRRAADGLMEIEGALLLSRALSDTGPFHRVLRRLPGTLLAPTEGANRDVSPL